MMNSKEGPNKGQNLLSVYEEDSRDSDIEARLYAEIHYTNNIIGDESNSVQNLVNNDLGNKENSRITEHHSAIPDLQAQRNFQISQSSNHAQSQQGIPSTSAQTNRGASAVTNSVHENPVQTQSNSNSNSKKRPLNTDSRQDGSKKKKKQNKNDNADVNNRIINPYHKNVVNNQQYGVKLLSPAFLHLLFGKAKSKKKKTAPKQLNTPVQPSKVNISYETPTVNVSQENVLLQNSEENQVTRNEIEASCAQDSEVIIDICSESSTDSIEDNSKYNNIEATDKKLSKQNSVVNNENTDEDTSDSSESIFEVPVPPKPAPVIIDLNDSDNENVESDDSDSSSSSENSNSCQVHSQNVNRSETNIENLEEHQVNRSQTNTEHLEEQQNCDSENNESVNLILNCTEIQKGVSSISDIKRLSHENSSANEINTTNASCANKTNTTYATDNSPNDIIEVLDHPVSAEMMDSLGKENTSVNKQVRKSVRIRDRQDAARDISFFKPMSDKLKSFYNDSWGGENFDLETLKSKMPRDPKKWAILDDDLIVSFSKRKRYFGVVCSRCQKEGHRQHQCPEPYKLPACYMCGNRGHFEGGCPEKKCLTCGKKQNTFRKTCEECIRMVCTRCNARGHMENCCPDLWRSYHHTVNNTQPNVPKNVKTVMKPQYSLYCCNCAKKGHDSLNCRKLRWSEHFPVPSHVTSYDVPGYSRENVGTENNLNNSTSFCDNSLTSSYSSETIAHRNVVYDKLPTVSRNQTLNADSRVIFKIRSKGPFENVGLVKAKFKLDIPRDSDPSKYNYWNGLSTFLYKVVEDMSGEFLLRQHEQGTVMEMRVPRRCRSMLEQIILQYAGRNNFERSYMYLIYERDPINLYDHLKNKFEELENLTLPKGILELHKELESLKSSENEQQQSNSFTEQKLIVIQKELLAALYKECCATNSLEILKKRYIKWNVIVKKIEKMSEKRRARKANKKLVNLNILLEYLFNYNNVFVPHEPCQLSSFIDTYKKHLGQRERLKNNPLLFPQENVVSKKRKKKSTAQKNAFSSTITTENVLPSSSATSNQIPSLLLINTSTVSQIQPTVSQIQPANSLIPATTCLNEPRPLFINTSISSNFHFTQNPSAAADNNADIVSSFSRKKEEKPNNYKRFLKKTRKLIEQARELNIPHVRKHIEILENKIKNGIYLYNTDAVMLRVLINNHR